jgi:short-subunit dehydrogenase
MDEKLTGKTIVITGASSGFGRGVVLKLAESRVNLVLAARREEILDELVEKCASAGSPTIAVPTDVSKEEDLVNLYNKALEKFGHFDVWINDAGGSAVGNFTDIPRADHAHVINVDLLGTIYGSHLALAYFKTIGKGNLINVASMLGKIPAPYYASYCAAKHGVVGLSAALRQELAEQKFVDIHVCTVMPMAMDTPFFEHAANYTGHESVPVPPVDSAEKVIDAMVDLIINPKGEVPVGNTSMANLIMHNAIPAVSEKIMGKITHKAQIVDAPAAPPTPGALKEPTAAGAHVHDPKIQKNADTATK